MAYHGRMAAPMHDWFLKEWMAPLDKKQADVVNDLDWNPAKISLMLRGKQPYTRDAVNELSAYLNIYPYELLMHPDDAMAIRRMQDSAFRIVAERQSQFRNDEENRRAGNEI